jgi:predicted nucleotidyltransferase component of viral defense system
MITRQQLQLLNRRTLKYPLDIAEKDYFLAEAIKLISESALGNKLIFKGGTALHHCYLPQYRFSEDLDFTSLDHELSMDEVVSVLESSGQFTVKKRYESSATIKIERLWHEGILAQPGAIKVEIDRKQNVVLAPIVCPYTNVWGIDVMVRTMDLLEVTAEKLRAAATRVRYRDFYDLYLILENPEVKVEDAILLLHRKEIRAPISSSQIREHWRLAQQEVNNDLRSIHRSRLIEHEAITAWLSQLQFDPILPG